MSSASMRSRLLSACASGCPATVDVPADYRRACRLLQISSRPETLLEAGYAAASGVALCGLVLAGIGRDPATSVAGLLTFLIAVCIAVGVRYGVPVAARARRVRLLGAAPSLVTLLTLGTSLWGNCERATDFATAASDRPLADHLATHARRSLGTPRSGLDTFAREWGEEFPALERAIERVQRATAAPADERTTRLASARQCILEGTSDEMGEFASGLRAPTTALYAFGVLLPLALVSLLPAARAAGIPVTTTVLAAIYGVALPLGLLAASGWVLAQRPLAFPNTPVPRGHPDVPARRWPAVAAGLAIGCVGGALVSAIGMGWGVPVAALGVGGGTALVWYCRPITTVRTHVTSVEADLPDVLRALGHHVGRGVSVEAALVEVAEDHSGPLATLVGQAADRQRILGVGVESAFRGDGGVLDTLPSARTRHAASLLAAAADIGPPAGDSLVAMGEHLEELQGIESELRRDIAQITGTLSNTAALFGPLVGGATVALAARMDSAGPLASPASTSLGLVVGWYVLVLATVLTALSTGLVHGLDRARVGYRVGLALLSATATYFTAVLVTGAVV